MSEGKNREIEMTLHLAHPIACVIEKQDDLLFCEDAHLGIIAYGDTRKEVMREFFNEFAVLWDIIAREEDSLLTADARLLKRRLTELVRKVEPHGDAQGTGDQRGAD
jgi:sulfur transfer complex TusBCD TusB component (DsrH family)